MFKLSAGTQIQVFAPFGEAGATLSAHTQGDISYVDTAPWKPYTTKEDKNSKVFFALVNPLDLQYLN